MKTRFEFSMMFAVVAGVACGQGMSRPVNTPTHSTPIQMVVTVETLNDNATPVTVRDVRALQGRIYLQVTGLAPLQGEAAGLELYILIDEKLSPTVTARFAEIKHFVSVQAPTTAVGVAYMDNGEAHVVQAPTTNHAQAATAIRLPSGVMSPMSNPYFSLSALIGRWPARSARREVLLVTNGVDRFEDVGGASMYLDVAIEDAQRAGVQVYCLYAPGLGHAGHSLALIQGGQNFLSQLAEQTGGEAYFKPGEAPDSFDPYLADIAKHLAHQYRVTFLAQPWHEGDQGPMLRGFQPIAFAAQTANLELISAHAFCLNPTQRP